MLRGSHEKCERIFLDQKPSKYFIIGSLADYGKDSVQGIPTGVSKVQAKSALKHNSMTIMFLIDKNISGQINVKPSCSLFYKVFPTYDEQKNYINKVNTLDMYESIRDDPGFKIFYKRKDCDFDSISLDLKSTKRELRFGDIIKEIYEDPDYYRTDKEINKKLKSKGIKDHFDIEWLKDKSTYEAKINSIKKDPPRDILNWMASIQLERESFDADKELISIRLINKTYSKANPKYEEFLFNCDLEIDLGTIDIIPFEYNFSHEGYNYEASIPLRTLNCHADYDIKNKKIISQPYAIHEQLKKVPRIEINGVKPIFRDLKASVTPLEDLLKEMKDQFRKYTAHPIFKDKTHSFHKQFTQETLNFEKIITRFEMGINILKNNKNARKAFELTNEVFERSSNYDGWRLFQIVFIIMEIPDIVDLKNNRSIADIIHVNTGGGKSEAYFGLVTFLLFWDRLRGKLKGVSAFSKFPLRMLSIQQLQRIAKIIALAEQVRKKHEISGSPFSVGYYVGVSEEFPRHTFEKIQQINKNKNKGKKTPGVLLNECPVCGAEIILEVDEDEHSIIHTCSKKACNKKYHLYFTNSEIYRFLPSLIVSTVDKLASVALNRRFKNLIGGKLSECPKGHGFTPINDSCEVLETPHKSCEEKPVTLEELVEGPTLMIQDEMHLLREGFGTIDSHFESFLNTLLKKFSKKEFKYISMTATVAGAQNQIDHLYGKNYFIFPGNLPRGYNEEDDFFFKFERKNDMKIIQRILIGLKPNLRDNQYASLLTIHHIADFIKNVREHKSIYAKKFSITEKELKVELSKYQCLLTYHGKKADVFGMNYFLHTVVTSKLEDFDIVGKPLTGDNTLTDIKDTIKSIQTFPEDHLNERRLHSTFATSVVSHGVDIDNWNIMIFQGITRDTSEYIQALSRAGRRYTGLIFLWFYPNRVRDLSYYKNFNLYHSILQQKVERTPISRWTKLGFKQTFTSIFCGTILNYVSNLVEKPLYTVEDVNNFFSETKNRELLEEFISEAYYTEMNRIGAKWIKHKIGEEVEDRLDYLMKYSGSANKFFFPNALRDSDEKFFKTQYGMRGIQDEITLKLNDNYTNLVNKYKK